MRFRICLLSLLAFISLSARSQDKIYKTDGTIISAIVKSVGQSTIIYKRFDNQNGPDYTILRKDVTSIVYQNGTMDYFKGDKVDKSRSTAGTHKQKNANSYGNNIITVIPAAFTAEVIDNSISDPGIGICYERMLDPLGHVSFVCPVMINFVQSSDFTSSIFNSYNNTYPLTGNYTSYLFMPGVKFYPADNTHKFRYSIGASLFALFGKEPYGVYDYTAVYGQSPNYWDYSMYGCALMNSLNISVSKNFYMEFDINSILPIEDNRVSNNGSETNLGALTPIMQMVLKAGYQF